MNNVCGNLCLAYDKQIYPHFMHFHICSRMDSTNTKAQEDVNQ